MLKGKPNLEFAKSIADWTPSCGLDPKIKIVSLQTLFLETKPQRTKDGLFRTYKIVALVAFADDGRAFYAKKKNRHGVPKNAKPKFGPWEQI